MDRRGCTAETGEGLILGRSGRDDFGMPCDGGAGFRGCAMATENQSRARAFFERLGGDESATDLVAALIKMLDDAEARGPARASLAKDRYALGLVADLIREKLRSTLARVPGHTGAVALPPNVVSELAGDLAMVIASELDTYAERNGDETDPIGPAEDGGR